MGTYTTAEYIDLFGGLPERGECAVDPDELRELAEERDASASGDGHLPMNSVCASEAACGSPFTCAALEACWKDRHGVAAKSEGER